jgi:perosamine synthetase
MNEQIVSFIRELFRSDDKIPLHAPVFSGNEKRYLSECIDSTFVSYVGAFVTQFEKVVAEFCGAQHAIAMVNGTLALHTALILGGVRRDDEVLTQATTFVATANAIRYCGADPLFIDSELSTLGMCPETLEEFLTAGTELRDDGYCYNKVSGRRIRACVPMHTFGHPCRIDLIQRLCESRGIVVIEDAAESLGSFYKGRHTGKFSQTAILSFNGNKVITTGGGGMVLTDDAALAARARHITTTAKQPHRWEFVHDELGYNYRMPNVNAAVGCAQMERIDDFLKQKRDLAKSYREFFAGLDLHFVDEPKDSQSNYWLNTVRFGTRAERDSFLQYSNDAGVMTRPMWTLLHKLPMYKDCQRTTLLRAQQLEDTVVNLPSSVRV